jgi:Fe-S cluster biogenesis protein NfuA
MVLAAMAGTDNDIIRVLKEVVAPMLAVEGGKLRVVSLQPDRLEVHLSGRLAGAPGTGLFCRRVLEPAIHAVAPGTRVVVTTGWIVPPGATEL